VIFHENKQEAQVGIHKVWQVSHAKVG